MVSQLGIRRSDFFRVGVLALVAAAGGTAFGVEPPGTMFTYQGQIKLDDVPYTGTCDAFFSLWNDPVLTDAGLAQVGPTIVFGGDAPTAPPIDVVDGLFQVELDFGATVFGVEARWLEIGVNCPADPTLANLETLVPRQHVTAVPFALQTHGIHVDDEGRVGIGTASPSSILHLRNTGTDIGLRMKAGNSWTAELRQTDSSLLSLINGGSERVTITPNGSVGVGTTAPASRLTVSRAAEAPAYQLELRTEGTIRATNFDGIRFSQGTDGSTTLAYLKTHFNNNGNPDMSLGLRSAPELLFLDSSASIGIGTTSPAAKLHIVGADNNGLTAGLRIDSGSQSLLLDGNEIDSTGALYLNLNSSNDVFMVTNGGSVGVGTAGVSSGRLVVQQLEDSSSGGATLLNTSGQRAFRLWVDSSNRSRIDSGATGADTLALNREANGLVTIGTTIHLDPTETGTDGAQVTLFDAAGEPNVLLDAEESDGGAALYMRGATNQINMELQAEENGGGGALFIRNGAGLQTVEIDSDESDSAAIRLWNSAGQNTITLDASVGGDGRITTQELQITGGSDLSEGFDVRWPADREPQGSVLQGLLVSIDPSHPGRLVVSHTAYDRTVVGVMSGAGGVKPGMVMGQRGTGADGAHPVALTGRVYVYADVSNGPIEPGDMLTTADRVGYAMKVTDFQRGVGATIGKAMSGLSNGEGLVLVLVNLQ